MEGCPSFRPAPQGKVELVRERLVEHFPNVRIRVRDPGALQPVAFLLRWVDCRDARVRVSWERFHDYGTADEILPTEALHALERGESILVTHDGIVIESDSS